MEHLADDSPPGLSAGRAALLAAAAGYAVLVAYQAFTLPDKVPGHVGPGGDVTWWGDRAGHVAIASALGLSLFLLMWFLPRLIGRMPQYLVNMPHKEYWLRPENLPRAQRMLADDLSWIGAATLAFVGYAMYEVGKIAGGVEPFLGAFWVVFALYMVGVIGWSLRMQFGSRWRPPRSHPQG